MENIAKGQDDVIVSRIKTDLKVIIPSFDFNNYLKKENTHSITVEKFCATLWDGSDLEVASEVPSINSSLSKSGVFSPAHSIKGPSPSPKQKPTTVKDEYHSTLYRVSSKSDGNKTVINREMSLPSETLGTVSTSLQFNDWIEVYYRVQQSCWLVEGLKHTIPVQISFREFSKILIFDDGITVTDAIEMLLESIEEDQETQQKHIYELYLQSFNKNDSSFCMEGERLLVSFGLHPQDTLVLKRRNQEIEETSVETVEKNQLKPRALPILKTPVTFRLTVLFPDLQLFQIFTVNSNMTVEQLKVLIMSRIADHPKFFNAFRVENEEERMLLLQGHSLSIPSKFGDSSKTIWMENDKTLSQYPVHLYPLIEFTKQLCGKIMVLDTHMNCVELKVPLHTVTFSKLLIYSNDARVKTIVATVKESLADYFAESFEFYGLYLPSLSDSSEWLKDERTLASYELDIHDSIEFKEDSRYNEIMLAAAKAFSITPTPHLLEGESIHFKKDYIHYISSSGKSIGTLYLTNYRILFMSNDRSTYDDTDDIRNVPLACIDTCQDSKQTDYIGININCKDWRTFALGFSSLDIRTQFLKIYKDISNYASPEKLFAFSNKEKLLVENGWEIFDIVAEYTRQGVYPSSQWRLTDINKAYKMSPSYPRKILVPASISDEDLVHSSNYRTRGRIPATCWIHPHNKASLTRCAQPKVGITRSRCAPDEAILNEIMKLSNNNVLYVIDSRPLANAVANTIMGKGTESTESYQHCKLKFLGIGNIHVMRESYNRLRNLCLASDGNSINWLSELESTGWLENISQILAGVVAVVDLLDKGYSVITHCSDGWDRTAQLTALAQLLLDPHYRTYIGFISLIEKEWLSFGHKFHERCGLGPRSPQEESPIFIQFIDIVWQILKQFPCSFQFNEHLLLTILDHLNSCRFGTFLFNCERERAEANLQKRTISLWSYVLSNIEQFLNPHYTITTRVLYPVPDLKRLQLWNNCYFRWDRKMKEQESTEAKTRQIREKCDQLTHQLREVEKQHKQKQKM